MVFHELPPFLNVLFLSLSRSPVFRAMLDSGMTEGQNGRVKVEDAELVTLRVLLQYLYTGRIGPDFKDYRELLILANKYQVEDLMEETSSKILESLTEDNALELGMFGEMYNSTVLLQASAKFIQENASKDILPDGWDLQLRGSPRLLLAIVAALREAGGKETEFHRFSSSNRLLSTGRSGSVYAIGFEVAAAAKLSAIALYGVSGSNKVALKIYKDELLLLEEEKEYHSLGGGKYTKLALKSRVNLEPNLVYTVHVEWTGPDKDLLCGGHGKNRVKVGNVAVTFSSSTNSVDGTDVKQGQIPSIYLCV